MAAEWKAQQEKEKNEEITIAYVYWDGSSHRKNTRMKKGATIAQFLAKAIEVEFPLDVCVLFFFSIFDFSGVKEGVYRVEIVHSRKSDVHQGRSHHSSFLHVSLLEFLGYPDILKIQETLNLLLFERTRTLTKFITNEPRFGLFRKGFTKQANIKPFSR